MVDFRSLLTDEQRRKIALRDAMYAEQRRRFASMTNDNLTASARYYMGQMRDITWKPGEPVYDAVFWHVIIPEMLKRLGSGFPSFF